MKPRQIEKLLRAYVESVVKQHRTLKREIKRSARFEGTATRRYAVKCRRELTLLEGHEERLERIVSKFREG